MTKAPSLPGLFVATLLFLALTSIGQAVQQQTTSAGSSTSDSGQTTDTTKSSANQLRAPQASSQVQNSEKPDSSPTSARRTSTNSGQVDVRSNDNDEKDDQPRRRSHIHLGTITVGAGYTRFPPGFFPYYGYGLYPFAGFNSFYSPYTPFAYGYFDPFYGPYYPGIYGGSLGYGADKGEVKLSTSAKGAQVYLDGAFAGPADKLKSMWLEPGAYNLSVSGPGQQKFEQRIYVISGKTLKIRAQLPAQ